ncbi:MAG: hypothetical protein WBB76_07605 [Gaiellaceae bacterium]
MHHLLLLSLASCVLALFRRGWDEWDEKAEPEPEPQPAANSEPRRKRSSTRRFATTVSFTALFFAGLALSAGAGNGVRTLLEDNSSTAAQTDTTATAPAPDTATGTTTTAAPTPQPAPVVQATQLQAHARPAAAPALLTARPSASANLARAAQRTAVAGSALTQATGKSSAKTPQAHKTRRGAGPLHVKPQPLDAEASYPGSTVWLYRAAPDPTPPAGRLRLSFARELVAYSRQAGVDWALELAVLRVDGHAGRVPATRGQVRKLAFRLGSLGGRANGWAAALSVSSDTAFADRVVALRHYYRAVGLASLVYGLLSQKRDLEDRVLHDQRLLIYPGGRQDVASHKVDARVLAVMLYLADTFHEVTVSCLISGHRLYARPGVVSAHIYGRAVDVAALGGVSVYGHQEPGGLTEQAVRSLLMLPGGMMPAQVISLLGLGGPSFPLANHYDHIHVGF